MYLPSSISFYFVTLLSMNIVFHEDEIRPMLAIHAVELLYWINNIQVVWACYCTLHKFLGSFVLTRHTCRHCKTNTKGSAFDIHQ